MLQIVALLSTKPLISSRRTDTVCIYYGSAILSSLMKVTVDADGTARSRVTPMEQVKFVIALIVCLVLILFVFAIAIYCRDRHEAGSGGAVVPIVRVYYS